MTVLIAFNFFAAVVFLTIGVRIEREQRSPLLRLRKREKSPSEVSPQDAEMRRPFLVRVLGPIAMHLLTSVARISPPALRDGIRRRLMMAGNPWNATSEEVIFAKLILAVSGAMLVFWAVRILLHKDPSAAAVAAVFGYAVGFLLPDLAIAQKAKERKKKIQRSLPYVLDLLCVSVEAGLAFDGAMLKVSEKVDGPLSDEFRRVNYEVRIGKSRRDALRDMRDRCGVEDLNTFIAAIIQAERLGLGIGQVLRVQADQMRVTRRERAREAAMKIPIKMLFPLIFLILPALFVIILGPALIQMMENVGNF